MEAAQAKLFDMAFRSPIAFESLFRIGDELRQNELQCIDVLQVEEDQLDSEDDFEGLRKGFLKTITSIKRKQGAISNARDDISSTRSKKKREEILARINNLEKEVVDMCSSLNLRR